MNYKNADGTWTVIGIVSYEHFLSCQNASSVPRAFTRVSSYVDWIKNVTKDVVFISSSTTESPATSTERIMSSSTPTTVTNSLIGIPSTQSESNSASTQAPIEPKAKNITSLDPIIFIKKIPFDVCGKSNGPGADPNNGTIQLIKSNDFPWLVNFYYDTLTEDDPFWCSGSIIGSKWILTAASCNLTLERYLFANHYVNHNIIIK